MMALNIELCRTAVCLPVPVVGLEWDREDAFFLGSELW
jgi:hypothetical protein